MPSLVTLVLFVSVLALLTTAMPAKNSGNETTGAGVIDFNIVNNCDYDIWPALLAFRGANDSPKGFHLGPFESRGLSVENNFQGRFWARTGCESKEDGKLVCFTGNCNDQFECAGSSGGFSGESPATLAEFNFAGWQSRTFYDISAVDGYNQDIEILAKADSGNKEDDVILRSVAARENPQFCPFRHILQRTNDTDNVTYMDNHYIPRSDFACLSGCAISSSNQDCCKNDRGIPELCEFYEPESWHTALSSVSPDVYNYAYDDKYASASLPDKVFTKWEITFCPAGSSTQMFAAARLEDERVRLSRVTEQFSPSTAWKWACEGIESVPAYIGTLLHIQDFLGGHTEGDGKEIMKNATSWALDPADDARENGLHKVHVIPFNEQRQRMPKHIYQKA